MRVLATFTLESDTQPLLTWKGVVNGPTVAFCTRLALKAARVALPRKHWSSLVIVLEKLDNVEVSHDPV